MIEIKLNLLTALDRTDLAERLTTVAFPERTQGKTAEYKGSEELLPADGFNVIVTDHPELARPDAENVYFVLIGSHIRLGDVNERADVWNAAESAEILCRRCEKLLVSIRDRLERDFYRTVLGATIDTVPDMLWYKRIDGIHMLVNDAFTEIVHKPKTDVIGKDHFYIWDAPRPAEGNDYACAESEEIAISTGKTYVCDEPVKTREGMKQFITYKTPIYDPFGEVFGTVGVGHDVTNFSNLGIELSILVENMPFPMTIFTPEWGVVRMNKAFKDLTGAQDAEHFNYRLWKLTVPIPVGTRYEDRNRHIASSEYRVESGGSVRNIMLTELEIRDYFDNITGYFCTIQDITYQRSYEDSIIKAANTDMLTGMYNRRYFYTRLNECVGKRFYLLYIDLDNFKAINDNYGHSAGDEVLICTAGLIRQYFFASVTARLGGDEFAVIDEDDSREVIEDKCAQLERAIAEEFKRYNCNTGASIGIVYNDGTLQDIDQLIHLSDEKMYSEKKKHHRAAEDKQ